jgi:hypothetical protein
VHRDTRTLREIHRSADSSRDAITCHIGHACRSMMQHPAELDAERSARIARLAEEADRSAARHPRRASSQRHMCGPGKGGRAGGRDVGIFSAI